MNYAREPSHACQPVGLNLVEGGGFEPPKLSRQIYSLIPLATREPLQKRAYILFTPQPLVNIFSGIFKLLASVKWSWREESNPRPADYKSAALPTELRQQHKGCAFYRKPIGGAMIAAAIMAFAAPGPDRPPDHGPPSGCRPGNPPARRRHSPVPADTANTR